MENTLETQVVEPLESALVSSLPPELNEPAEAMRAFKQFMEIFTQTLHSYDGGRRQLIRAWTNAAVSPLNDGPLQFSYPEEKEIFELYKEIESVKLILMVHGLASAGVLTLHKPLMEAIPRTASEVQLQEMMGNLGGQLVENKE